MWADVNTVAIAVDHCRSLLELALKGQFRLAMAGIDAVDALFQMIEPVAKR